MTTTEIDEIKSKSDNATIIGRVFVGGYTAIFGWLFLHSLLGFWDILIPWNISLSEHIYFYGSFTLYIIFIGLIFAFLWSILVSPGLSEEDGSRWPLATFGNFAIHSLSFSNMSDEPFPRIGSGWFTDDLRYPTFMSQPYIYMFFMLFLNDAVWAFNCTDLMAPTTFLLRPWLNVKVREEWAGWQENLKGICCLAYIYFGYWFIFMVVSRSWIERIILYTVIMMVRSYFGMPKAFHTGCKYYFLAIVPIYALVRGYYSYVEWRSYGSKLSFTLKLVYCLSQVVIFAGWNSLQKSALAQWTWPYLRVNADGNQLEERTEVIDGQTFAVETTKEE